MQILFFPAALQCIRVRNRYFFFVLSRLLRLLLTHLKCTQVSLIVCKKKSPHWRHPPLKSKLSLHPNVNIRYGLAVQFWHLCQHFNKCGFRNRNMMRVVHRLFTGNAFKENMSFFFFLFHYFFFFFCIIHARFVNV